MEPIARLGCARSDQGDHLIPSAWIAPIAIRQKDHLHELATAGLIFPFRRCSVESFGLFAKIMLLGWVGLLIPCGFEHLKLQLHFRKLRAAMVQLIAASMALGQYRSAASELGA
jgi:hypothetical protein